MREDGVVTCYHWEFLYQETTLDVIESNCRGKGKLAGFEVDESAGPQFFLLLVF